MPEDAKEKPQPEVKSRPTTSLIKLTETFTFGRLATIIILFIGLIGALLTIYAFFFQERKIDLQYQIIANSNVLDIRAELTKLDILYNGNNLKQKNQNLRVINLRIINTGTEHILNTFYDDNDLLGFKVVDGEIIENPEVLDASNEYLKNNLIVTSDSTNLVRFSKVIIESREFFVLKVLILHKRGASPSIIPVGKVAGVSRIALVNKIEVTETKSFFKKVFEGNLWVQIAKSFFYFLIVLVAIIIIALSGAGISDLKDKVKRKKLVKEFISTSGFGFTRMDEVIFERYKKDGVGVISDMNKRLRDEKVLNEHYQNWLKSKKENNVYRDMPVERIRRMPDERFFLFDIFNHMINDGLVVKEGNQLKINHAMKKTLNAFSSFLEEKGELEKYSDVIKAEKSESNNENESRK
jgi:hypothetical protein